MADLRLRAHSHRRYVYGESLRVHVRVTNASTRPIDLVMDRVYPRLSGNTLSVTHAQVPAPPDL
jgi:hypothetical protein